jgi:hypothetical protein
MGEKLVTIELLAFVNWFYDVYLAEHPGETTEPRTKLLTKYFRWKHDQIPGMGPPAQEEPAKVYSFEQLARRGKVRNVHPINTNAEGYGPEEGI